MIQPLIQLKIRYNVYSNLLDKCLQDKNKLITINLGSITNEHFTGEMFSSQPCHSIILPMGAQI